MRKMPVLFISLVLLGLAGCVASPYLKKGDEFYASQDYVQALQNYELALPQTREGKARQDLESKILAAREQLIRMAVAKADSQAQSADPDMFSGVKQALATLQEAMRWDSGQGLVQEKISGYQQKAAELEAQKQELRGKAWRSIQEFRFPEALEFVQQAQSIDIGDTELQAVSELIVKMHELNQSIVNAVNNENIDQARIDFTSMASLSPVPLSFANYPLRTTIVDLARKRIKDMELQNRWYEAYMLLDTLGMDDLQADLQRVRASGSQYYYQKSSVAILDEQDYFLAYLLAVTAAMLDDSDIRVFRRLQETQDAVNKSIQSHIAVATFDTPSNDPDAGRQFSDSLISYLYSVLPYGINILERDKIDYALREQLADNQSAGRMLGVDLMVTGSVSLFKVDTSIDKRNATVTVKVGEESVPNPEYQQMAARLGPDTTLWPVVPPMMIPRDKTQIMTYSRGTGETRGFAKVSVRIFDTQKGTISFVKDFDANVGYESEFQDEVAEADIEYKPLRLPSETEVKEQMRKEIVAQVAQVVQASFEAREHRFLNLAQFYLDRREPGLAVRPVAQGYYYALQDNIPEDNPAVVKTRALLFSLIKDLDMIMSKPKALQESTDMARHSHSEEDS